MSLKDFEIGSKLGKEFFTQAKELIQLFSRLRGRQINKSTL
jgi:hypothetical protein